MGQPSSAQREPSMEEILASIRKIIEDTDDARPVEPAEPQDEQSTPVRSEDALDPAPVADAHDPVIELDERGVSEPGDDVSAFRDVFQERNLDLVTADDGEVAPASASEPARPFSLSDVQRRVMRERGTPDDAEPLVRDDSASADAASPLPVVVVGDDDDNVTSQHSFADDHGHALPRDADNQRHKDHGAPSIISEHAGRQVAGAFDELKDAFFASRKRSFDDMAEEMMRPMLQEWLDNNLPHLVERLVREEIERIARGE